MEVCQFNCFMCDSCEETFQHFMCCFSYRKPFLELECGEIFGGDPEKLNTIALEVNKRNKIRKSIEYRRGRPASPVGSPAPGHCQATVSFNLTIICYLEWNKDKRG